MSAMLRIAKTKSSKDAPANVGVEIKLSLIAERHGLRVGANPSIPVVPVESSRQA